MRTLKSKRLIRSAFFFCDWPKHKKVTVCIKSLKIDILSLLKYTVCNYGLMFLDCFWKVSFKSGNLSYMLLNNELKWDQATIFFFIMDTKQLTLCKQEVWFIIQISIEHWNKYIKAFQAYDWGESSQWTNKDLLFCIAWKCISFLDHCLLSASLHCEFMSEYYYFCTLNFAIYTFCIRFGEMYINNIVKRYWRTKTRNATINIC